MIYEVIYKVVIKFENFLLYKYYYYKEFLLELVVLLFFIKFE